MFYIFKNRKNNNFWLLKKFLKFFILNNIKLLSKIVIK